MADPIVINSCYIVAIQMESSGQDVVNVIGIRAPFSNAVEVGEAVKAQWELAGGPLAKRPVGLTMKGYRVTDITSPIGPVVTVSSSKPGTVGGNLATNGSAALISYSGGSRSRSTSGRMYHGPLTETDINSDGRTIAPLTASSLSVCYQTFAANLAAAGFEWVVISRKLSLAFPVNSPQCQSIIATQRRRIRGRS